MAQATSSKSACCSGGASWGGQLTNLSFTTRPVPGASQACSKLCWSALGIVQYKPEFARLLELLPHFHGLTLF